MSSNKISVFPEEMRRLVELKELLADNNKLTVIPEWVGGFASLTRLYLNVNQIRDIPSSLIDRKDWIKFNLDGNPLHEEVREKTKRDNPKISVETDDIDEIESRWMLKE